MLDQIKEEQNQLKMFQAMANKRVFDDNQTIRRELLDIIECIKDYINKLENYETI